MPKTIAGRKYIFLWKKTRRNDKPTNKKAGFFKILPLRSIPCPDDHLCYPDPVMVS